MKTILSASVLSFALVTGSTSAQDMDSAGQTASVFHDEELAIRQVVMDYFWGRQNGDSAQMGRAFDLDNGHFKMVRRSPEGDEIRVFTLAEFAGWANGPLDAPNQGRIVMVDIVEDQMAFVKFELKGEARTFIDYFTLYKTNNTWSIINKTSAVFDHPTE